MKCGYNLLLIDKETKQKEAGSKPICNPTPALRVTIGENG